MTALLSEWLTQLPTLALFYLVAFGVRLGSKENPIVQIHGVVTSFWIAAQGIGSVDKRLDRIEENTKPIPALVQQNARIEKALEAPRGDSIQFSIPR
jgi:hypothetical protein